MGLFGKLFGDSGDKGNKKNSSGYEPSGSKGKPGRGYGKGNVQSNPDKYRERTEAQRRRSERQADRMG
jgi:hypothetical protein